MAVVIGLFVLALVFLLGLWYDEKNDTVYWKQEALRYQKLWDDLRHEYNSLRRETEDEEWKS